MQAWTDYPLCKSDTVWGPVLDEPEQEAPVREVEVLGWDGNKYARVKFEKGIYSFKVGYLYTRPFRMTMDCDYKDIPTIDYHQLPEVDVYADDHDSVHWDGERWVCDYWG